MAIDAEEEIVGGPGTRGAGRIASAAAPGVGAKPEAARPSLAVGGTGPEIEDAAAVTGPLSIPVAARRETAATSEPAAPAAISDSGYLADAGRLVAGWARGRSLGPGSAYGIAAAFGLCAAAWFTAGTRTDSLRGVAALCAAYLASLAGRGLAHVPPPVQRGGGAGRTTAEDYWLPTAENPLAGAAVPLDRATEARAESQQARGAESRWLAAVSWWIPECAVYGCLAVGATADGWGRMWSLALAAMSLVAVRDMMTACLHQWPCPASTSARAPVPGDGARAVQAAPALADPVSDDPATALDRARRLLGTTLQMPAGVRVMLIGVVTPVAGPRAALLTVLVCTGVAVVIGIATHDPTADQRKAAGVVRLRDDGVLARQAGRLVRGNVLPLPPAVLGFAAVITISVLGMRNLSGVLVLGPALVMLLAAPGSGSDHTGQFDWLVPFLLLGGQLVYFAALGAPGPVTFALCAALLLRYTDLASPANPARSARSARLGGPGGLGRGSAGSPAHALAAHESWLGWEGRMLLAGLAAGAGLATFAYLALTAYLGVLIGAKLVTSALREEPASDRRGSGGRS
jgi:Family of unknown function (DUF5941)